MFYHLKSTRKTLSALLGIWVLGCLGICQAASPIPPSEITALDTQLKESSEGASAARKGLSLKRIVRGAEAQLSAHPDAPNRYEILNIMFRAQQELVALDNSSSNREALIETCRQLAAAPNDYAAIRLDADLMLSQVELAQQGADLQARGQALLPLIKRYQDTDIEAKVLRLAMLMALEFGDIPVVSEIREIIAERFPQDLDLIIFQREQLKGQVFGAPFVGSFKSSDGKNIRFPLDGLGRTTMVYFWTKENEGLGDLTSLVKTCKENKDMFGNRIRIVSVNLDELPDAGEKSLRDLGVDWPALHLPGGRANKIFQAFGRGAPSMVTVTPTGYAALFMSAGRDGGVRDYERWAGSSLAREWNRDRYGRYLQSLFIGEPFILPMAEHFDPAFPPELKAVPASVPLKRDTNFVPEEALKNIQDCFVSLARRTASTDAELLANYRKADDLCKQAIAAHAQAPDLWVVRNRRMIALLGLWKLTADRAWYESALAEAKALLAEQIPPGVDTLARFCVAREALHDEEADAAAIIKQFHEDQSKASPGQTLALASVLALDVADRQLHERYRSELLQTCAEEPMMWSYTNFLLDRHVRYWLYRAPYTGGWSFGRRQTYFMQMGTPDEVTRRVEGQLETMDGKPFKIPADTQGKWQVIVFAGDWTKYGRSPMPLLATTMQSFATNRPMHDVQFSLALMDDEGPSQVLYKNQAVDCRILRVPGGYDNPLIQKAGVLSVDQSANALIIRPDGAIAAALSGFAFRDQSRGEVLQNIIYWHDEEHITALIEKGQAEEALSMALALAPVWDPEAPENKRRRKPQYSLHHLRSRARAYLAMKDYDSALRDAEEVVKRQSSVDGGMSLTTQELIDAEALRDKIQAAIDKQSSQ
jgi:hypothetical protein